MNIVKENIDNLTALLKVQISKEDYADKVSKLLKDYQKKASIKGFRPGKVPASFIEKTYRIPVMVEEINKLVSHSIDEYLKTEKIQILGDPMPSETENKPINWEQDTEFNFTFELGLAPIIEASVTEKDKIDYFSIKIEDKMIEGAIDNYTRRYGKYSDTNIVEENELLKADVAEANGGSIKSEDVTLSLEIIKDDAIKKKFVGKKVGDTVTIDIKKAYPNDTEISSILKISKEEVATISSDFEITIKSLSKFEKAEVNQKLIDLIFGENIVIGEDQFRNKIIEDIKASLDSESDYKFYIDAKKYLIGKTKAELPKDFLVRWMLVSNKGKFTKEQIDNEYPVFAENLKWQLIRNNIIKDAEIKFDDNDLKTKAKELARQQFRQYGIANIGDEYLENYSADMLKNQESVKQMVERIFDDKTLAYIKGKAKLNTKDITVEEFNKLFEQ